VEPTHLLTDAEIAVVSEEPLVQRRVGTALPASSLTQRLGGDRHFVRDIVQVFGGQVAMMVNPPMGSPRRPC
jgi:hypothetical protein